MITLILFFVTIIIGIGILHVLHKLAQFNQLYKQMFEIHAQEQGEKELRNILKKVMKEPLFKPLQQYKGYVIKIEEVIVEDYKSTMPFYKALVLSNDMKIVGTEIRGSNPEGVLDEAKYWIDNPNQK